MRIDPSQPVSPIVSDKPVQAPAHRGQAARGGDVVQLSAAGAAASTAGTSSTDPARIAQLKAAVQSGSYKPDLEKLASAIVNEEAK
jgi:flagellar biosynthesis anti-sigma factor FlgM